jgi:hypothetical protein
LIRAEHVLAAPLGLRPPHAPVRVERRLDQQVPRADRSVVGRLASTEASGEPIAASTSLIQRTLSLPVTRAGSNSNSVAAAINSST